MASIDYRNGSFRITVSLGYDIYGKRIRETATFVPDQNLSPKKQRKSAEEFAAQFEAQKKTAWQWTGARSP